MQTYHTAELACSTSAVIRGGDSGYVSQRNQVKM